MTLEVKNLTRAVRRAAELQKRVHSNDTLEPIGRDLATATRNKAPVDDGGLRASIRHSVEAGKLKIGAAKEGWYWRFVEFGTSSHPIIARRARFRARGRRRGRGSKVLASDDAVFGPRVQHPGSRPRPFVRPVIDESRGQMTRTLARKLKDLARFG